MKNILFFAFEFPPLISGGSFRPYFFAKFLPDYDIMPIVITLDPVEYPKRWSNVIEDHALFNELDQIPVIPVKGIFRSDWITRQKDYWCNAYLGGREVETWYPNILKTIPDIVDKYQPDAILATGPPFSVLEIARRIAIKYNLPLITDLRDAWSQWCYTPYSSILKYWYTVKAERKVLKAAKTIITTSPQTSKDLQEVHSIVAKNKFHVITNGYKEKFEVKESIELNPDQQTIKIGYVGSFYFDPVLHNMIFTPWYKKIRKGLTQPFIFQYVPQKENWHYRTPYYFFKTLQLLLQKNPQLINRLKIVFAGKKPVWFNQMVKQFQLTPIVDHIGKLSHAESLNFQQNCDLLLLTSAKINDGKDYSIAGKTFEYFSMQKPILGFVTEGAQKEILQKSGIAVICNPDNPVDSAAKLESIVNKGITLNPNRFFIESLWRKPLTEKLAKLIQDVIPKSVNEMK